MNYLPLGAIANQSLPLDPKLYQSEYQCSYPFKVHIQKIAILLQFFMNTLMWYSHML